MVRNQKITFDNYSDIKNTWQRVVYWCNCPETE